MKNKLLFALLTMVSFAFGLKLNFNNDEYNITTYKNYSCINFKTSYPLNIKGKYQQKIKSFYFEIPKNKEIKSVIVTPLNIKHKKISNRLVPSIVNKKISDDSSLNLYLDEKKYKATKNSNYLHHFGSSICANKNIGFVSVYNYMYDDKNLSVQIPAQFSVQLSFKNKNNQKYYPQNVVSNNFVNSKIDHSTRQIVTAKKGYLLIVPTNLANFYNDLILWRKTSGFNTFIATTDDINNMQGLDITEKTRNLIKKYHTEKNISFVTIAANEDIIPTRKFFAFDCEYGAYADENQIPADMYFSNLNGNFDANANGIYGEDADEIDYFAEVYVSRLPLKTQAEIQDYTNRLITYEKGFVGNYQTAGGVSTQLWANANSQACQNYIYNKYFKNYDINFLIDEENVLETAYSMFEENKNIVQHTGHANIDVLGLNHSYIRLSNLNMLNNNWGGVFYSIGCWSLALDYTSIGEKLVTSKNKGFLGYVGNSRYGWGAPSASGFGFSEFYQKEFFKNLFVDDYHYLAQLNAMQKVPFIGYWKEKSVYKWVGYQLNSVGDAAFYINSKNVDSLKIVTKQAVNDTLNVYVFNSNSQPIKNCFVTSSNGSTYVTNANGLVKIKHGTYSFYKQGYKYKQKQIQNQSLVCFVNDDVIKNIKPKQSIDISLKLKNNSPNAINSSIALDYNLNLLNVNSKSNLKQNIKANSTGVFNFSIGLTKNGLSLPANSKITLTFKDFNSNVQITYTFIVVKNMVQLIATQAFDSAIKPNTTTTLNLCFKNTGSFDVEKFKFEISPQNNLPNYIKLSNNKLNFKIAKGKKVSKILKVNVTNNAPSIFKHNVLVDCYINNEFLNQQNFMLYSNRVKIDEDFENEIMFSGSDVWKKVKTTSYSGSYCYSPRAGSSGSYTVSLPPLIYSTQNNNIEFMYKYKMPMYGSDGLYVLLNKETTTDTLIFMGSGGALANKNNPQIYIYGDWQKYKLDLSNIISPLAEGEIFTISLKFVCPTIIENFSNYKEISDIGIFIDDFKYNLDAPIADNNYNKFDFNVKIIPNPFNDFAKISYNVVKDGLVNLSIYNIRGQKLKTLVNKKLNKGEYFVSWNANNKNNKHLATGIYFLYLKNGSKTVINKMLLLK